jgi:hypothetical protein
VSIYTKHGKKVLSETIRIDGDCYFADKVIKIRAVVEGETASRLLYVTDLLADDGRREIEDVIKAVLKKR